MAKAREVVLGVTGSIAAYKACEVVRRLREARIEITVVMTEAAMKFVAPLTFQTLSGRPVFTGMFSPVREWNPVHLSLAERAGVILIAPATANVIGKIAAGIADELLTATVLAAKVPVVICPAMNERMYRNKIVQENLARLKKAGYEFIGPERGKLASGCEGLGRLARIETIVARVKELL